MYSEYDLDMDGENVRLMTILRTRFLIDIARVVKSRKIQSGTLKLILWVQDYEYSSYVYMQEINTEAPLSSFFTQGDGR